MIHGERPINQSSSIPLLDDVTKCELQWHEVWERFQPVTAYGKRWKASAKPFLPGQESMFAMECERLESDVTALKASDVRALRASMQKIRDVHGIVSAIHHPNYVASTRELLELKQFLVALSALAEEAAVQSMDWDGTSKPWEALLRLFGLETSQAFALTHVADQAYRDANEELAKALQELIQATRERDRTLFDKFGKRPNREGRLLLSLPEDAAVAGQWKETPGFRWLQDTPFESVFEVLPSPDMEAAVARVDPLRELVNEQSRRVLERMTRELQAHYPLWLEAEHLVEELDVRVAKVQFGLDIGGGVCRLADRPAVAGGVHVVVADRLQSTGRTFTQVTFSAVAGVSLICGSNMGGKTVAMATLCICQALAQFGLPVPAWEFETTLVSAIRVCATAATDTGNGLSSFGAEITRLREVWQDAESGGKALLVFDEPGKSTNPVEGEALVVGLLRALAKQGKGRWFTLLATHFTAPAQESCVKHYKMRGLDGSRLPNADDKVVSPTDGIRALEEAMSYVIEDWDQQDLPQEAIQVAKWLNAPDAVLAETAEYLQRGKRL